MHVRRQPGHVPEHAPVGPRLGRWGRWLSMHLSSSLQSEVYLGGMVGLSFSLFLYFILVFQVEGSTACGIM